MISGENSSLESMGTDQLLDLFSHKPTGASCSTSNRPGGMQALIESLPDLWDHKQYEDEYDLSNFMTKLQN